MAPVFLNAIDGWINDATLQGKCRILDSLAVKKYRNTIAVLACALLLLAVLLYQPWWPVQRRVALAVILKEAKSGRMALKWLENGKFDLERSPANLLKSTVQLDVTISSRMTNPQRAGRALACFGNIRRITIHGAHKHDVEVFLENFSYQASCEDFFSAYTPLDDGILKSISRFRSLTKLYLSDTEISGHGFPKLPELIEVEIDESPVTDGGLIDILSCPKIRRVDVRGSKQLSAKGIIAAVGVASPTLETLEIRHSGLSSQDSKQVWEEVRKARPNLKALINSWGATEPN